MVYYLSLGADRRRGSRLISKIRRHRHYSARPHRKGDSCFFAATEAKQHSAAIAAIKEIGVLSGIRIERSERGMPGEFDWLEKLSVDELRLLADGKLDIASYRKDGDAARSRPN